MPDLRTTCGGRTLYTCAEAHEEADRLRARWQDAQAIRCLACRFWHVTITPQRARLFRDARSIVWPVAAPRALPLSTDITHGVPVQRFDIAGNRPSETRSRRALSGAWQMRGRGAARC